MAIGFHVRKSNRSSDADRTDHWIVQAKCDAEQSICEEVVIDLSDVYHINSNDLSDLIRLQLRVKHSGQRLVLCNVQETILQVFTLTRLDRLIEMRIDQAEGVPRPHLNS
jgi:anti-anti-sigma factor